MKYLLRLRKEEEKIWTVFKQLCSLKGYSIRDRIMYLIRKDVEV